VLAVVTAGLILAHRSPRDQDPEARLVEAAVWSTIQFLLEGAVFVLIGLQLRWIVTEVDSGVGELVAASVVVLGVVVLVRPAYIFLIAYVGRLLPGRARAREVTPGQLAVVSWAGMRGVVSLAAGLSLPVAIGERNLLLFLTVVVILGTLVVQGLTLPWVIRKAGVKPPDPHADAVQKARAQQLAAAAATARLQDIVEREHPPPAIVERLQRRLDVRAAMAWAEADTDSPHAGAVALYRQMRSELIDAERKVLVDLRDAGELDDEVLREVQRELDLENAMLQAQEEGPQRGGMLEELLPAAPADEG
jgi:CPA1 family monovalent cation:H+ antiporter